MVELLADAPDPPEVGDWFHVGRPGVDEYEVGGVEISGQDEYLIIPADLDLRERAGGWFWSHATERLGFYVIRQYESGDGLW